MRVDCAWRENQGFFGAAPKHPPQALWSIRSHILAHPVHRLSISIHALHIAQCSLGVFRAACNRGPSVRAPLAGSTQFWPCLIAPRHWRDLPSGDTSRSREDRAKSWLCSHRRDRVQTLLCTNSSSNIKRGHECSTQYTMMWPDSSSCTAGGQTHDKATAFMKEYQV